MYGADLVVHNTALGEALVNDLEEVMWRTRESRLRSVDALIGRMSRESQVAFEAVRKAGVLLTTL